VVEAIVVETLETAPPDATHWSSRGLAARHGISHTTVREIWRAFGLKPWRQASFKVSPDPDLVEKIRDLVALYMNPPIAAAVFAVDEKPQIQALNRTAPTLPMLPTTPARATHDYQRNGTCDLFAALEIATGKVITDIRPHHTSADFVAFLNKLNRNVPPALDVHVILDNLATHKTPTVHKWLLRHRRFHFHFTPTYGSWMNLVERWFSALTTKKLQRSAHRNVTELAADIQAWANTWNENPTPFVWHKTAEQILERLAAWCHWCLREDGDRSGEAVHGVAAADRTELAGTDNEGVVVGGAEQPAAAPVAGEHERAPGGAPGQQGVQVLIGTGRIPHLELHGRPHHKCVATATAPEPRSTASTPRMRKSPRSNSSLVSSITTPKCRPCAASSRSTGGRRSSVVSNRSRARRPPSS
jgi:transposase